MSAFALAKWLYEKRYLHRRIREFLARIIAPDFRSGHEFSTDFYGIRWVGRTDNYVDYQVLLRGAYEKFMLNFMRDVLTVTGKDKTVLDIGANIGNHALFLSKFASTVHAFEPYEPFRVSLEKKLSINRIDNVIVHPIGLSNEKESIPYYLLKEGATGSFQKGFFPGADEKQALLDVEIGDDFMSRENISGIALIKIDTDGFEIQVLTGLRKTLEANRPLVIFESVHKTRETTDTDLEKIEKMFPHDYLFFEFVKRDKKKGKYALRRINDLNSIRSNDIIACPGEKARLLK